MVAEEVRLLKRAEENKERVFQWPEQTSGYFPTSYVTIVTRPVIMLDNAQSPTDEDKVNRDLVPSPLVLAWFRMSLIET